MLHMTARLHIIDVLRAGTINSIQQFVPFISTCPGCGAGRPQSGFSCSDLERLLRRGHPIEAFCPTCDEYWSISIEERRELAERLAVDN